jgi:hypothetical protein
MVLELLELFWLRFSFVADIGMHRFRFSALRNVFHHTVGRRAPEGVSNAHKCNSGLSLRIRMSIRATYTHAVGQRRRCDMPTRSAFYITRELYPLLVMAERIDTACRLSSGETL